MADRGANYGLRRTAITERAPASAEPAGPPCSSRGRVVLSSRALRFSAARIAMGRFASTVAYYENARPPYGAAFFAAVARELGFNRSQRLLDIGAGPGLLAIGFAPYCSRWSASIRSRRWSSRPVGGRGRRRRGRIHRRPFRGPGRGPRRVRRRHDRPRNPLARSRSRANGPRSRSQAARQDSRLPRLERRRRPQPLAWRLQGDPQPLEGRSPQA